MVCPPTSGSTVGIVCRLRRNGLVETGLFEALNEISSKLADKHRAILCTGNKMRGQEESLFPKGTKGYSLLCRARGGARRQECSPANSAHHFTGFRRVRDVVNAFRPDVELPRLALKRIV